MKWPNKIALLCLGGAIVGISGCAKDSLSRALYSMGEQAQCATSTDNRIDSESRRANCLADAMTTNEFDDYNKARQEHLDK